MRNWAGNVVFRAAERTDLPDLGRGRARVVGTAHSFSRIADTDGRLVDASGWTGHEPVDEATATVRVRAGTRYAELARGIHARGWALANLASLPHISVAGSVATGTHGSGDRVGCLSTQVVSFRLVPPEGEPREVTDVEALAVHLGMVGVVTDLTLRVEPTYDVAQRVFEDVPPDVALAARGDGVSLFTTWRTERFDQVWIKNRVATGDPRLDGARAADGPRHPIAGADPDACTEQGGVPGPWHERLPHFRPEHTPSAGDELQTEYFVPRENLADALAALAPLRPEIARLVAVSEIRTVAGDALWLSPAYGRDSAAVHFTWRPDGPGVRALLPEIEAALAPFGARPHWGKLSALPMASRRGLWPRFEEFDALRRTLDPEGRLENAWWVSGE